MTIDLEEFKAKLQSFPSEYMKDFDEFWKWKLKIENRSSHILNDVYREGTGDRLYKILRSWQTYRPYGISEQVFRNALKKISNAYNQIRNYSLLEFTKIPSKSLKLVWHELGCIKEEHEKKNSRGNYSIISICKPLVLLWGQTLPFDSRNRSNIPPKYCVPKDAWRWNFETWKRIMGGFQKDLNQNLQAINRFKEVSLEKYGTCSIVPYGRLLDIYYF